MIDPETTSGIRRLLTIIFLCFGSVVVAAALVASGLALEWLFAIGIDRASTTFKVIKAASTLFLGISAIVVAACGAILMAGEAILSTWHYFKRWKP